MRFSLFVVVTCVAASGACSQEPARQPVVAAGEPTSVAENVSTATPIARASTAPATVTTMTGARDGEPIALRGRVSKVIWQHMTTSVAGKKLAYFDLDGGKEQTIVYWKEPPTCAGDVEVTGKVLEVRGPSKRPHAQESKVDDTYSERHVDVATARCVAP